MFAIAFDLSTAELKKHYGEPYNSAYIEVQKALEFRGFKWTQGSLYITDNDDMANLMLALNDLKKIEWFSKSVKDIRSFRVENWSNFTDYIKNTRNE